MAEEKETKGKKGWLRAAFGALAGLCSGAVIMYLTPLVDKVVKGDPPLANFDARPDGLNVTFHNLSGGSKSLEGWWDFGDGSALTPLTPDKDVQHTYTRSGNYTAKLTVRTLLGETNDRSVTLQLDSGGATAVEQPHILSLTAVQDMPGAPAPATFKVATEMKNAQMAVWDLDADRPLEVSPIAPGPVERLVTFQKPGSYHIKLAAFNGQQHEEKTLTVNVPPAPPGSLNAVLTVIDQGIQVERKDRTMSVCDFFPVKEKGNSYSFKHELKAAKDWTITDAKASPVPGSTGVVRNLQVQRDADGKTVHLTGELVRNSSKELPMMALQVVLTEERKKPAPQQMIPAMASLTVPGTAWLPLPPLPAGWEAMKRQFKLELKEGDRSLWQDASLPTSGVAMNLRNRRWTVTAVQTGNRIQLTIN
jgi:hypothetical protein